MESDMVRIGRKDVPLEKAAQTIGAVCHWWYLDRRRELLRSVACVSGNSIRRDVLSTADARALEQAGMVTRTGRRYLHLDGEMVAVAKHILRVSDTRLGIVAPEDSRLKEIYALHIALTQRKAGSSNTPPRT